MYSYILRKPKKFDKISTVDLSYVVPVKSTVKILQNSVAFSEYILSTIETPLDHLIWKCWDSQLLIWTLDWWNYLVSSFKYYVHTYLHIIHIFWYVFNRKQWVLSILVCSPDKLAILMDFDRGERWTHSKCHISLPSP